MDKIRKAGKRERITIFATNCLSIISDKGVKGYDVAIPIFSNSVNHLGKAIQVSPDYMLDSFPTILEVPSWKSV